jgi:hypothetical protein
MIPAKLAAPVSHQVPDTEHHFGTYLEKTGGLFSKQKQPVPVYDVSHLSKAPVTGYDIYKQPLFGEPGEQHTLLAIKGDIQKVRLAKTVPQVEYLPDALNTQSPLDAPAVAVYQGISGFLNSDYPLMLNSQTLEQRGVEHHNLWPVEEKTGLYDITLDTEPHAKHLDALSGRVRPSDGAFALGHAMPYVNPRPSNVTINKNSDEINGYIFEHNLTKRGSLQNGLKYNLNEVGDLYFHILVKGVTSKIAPTIFGNEYSMPYQEGMILPLPGTKFSYDDVTTMSGLAYGKVSTDTKQYNFMRHTWQVDLRPNEIGGKTSGKNPDQNDEQALNSKPPPAYSDPQVWGDGENTPQEKSA